MLAKLGKPRIHLQPPVEQSHPQASQPAVRGHGQEYRGTALRPARGKRREAPKRKLEEATSSQTAMMEMTEAQISMDTLNISVEASADQCHVSARYNESTIPAWHDHS